MPHEIPEKNPEGQKYETIVRENKDMKQKKSFLTKAAAILLISCLAVCSAGCGKSDTKGSKSSVKEEVSTDQLYSDRQSDASIPVFQINGQVFTVENIYPVNAFIDEGLKDGGFYRITADVTYLNGGVAGYVDFPQIDSVTDCVEISPFDLNLPTIRDKHYGLVLIGDYADGDLFLRENGMTAVWKDGSWTWQYSHEVKREDGTRICLREGLTQEEAEKEISNGILSCEDYLVVPAD